VRRWKLERWGGGKERGEGRGRERRKNLHINYTKFM